VVPPPNVQQIRHNLRMINRDQRCQEMTFIVGAGASVAPPANLPLFAELRTALIRTLKLSEGATVPNVVEIAETLAPETFMQCIFDGELPIEEWLTMTLGRGAPNPVHAVLAEAIREGARIWTVNVDELIETAAGTTATVAVLGDECPPADANLLKPHGTVSRGQYIFRRSDGGSGRHPRLTLGRGRARPRRRAHRRQPGCRCP